MDAKMAEAGVAKHCAKIVAACRGASMCATGHRAGCQMSMFPDSAPRPDGLPKHAHLGLACASLGKRGDMSEVDKGLLKYPCHF